MRGPIFGIPQFQKLTRPLRIDINNLVERVNEAISTGVSKASPPASMYVHYIDVIPRFNGHRFCETAQQGSKSMTDPNIWLWNVAGFGAAADDITTGDPTPNDNEASENGICDPETLPLGYDCDKAYDQGDLKQLDQDPSELEIGIAGGTLPQGLLQRVLHPKPLGHGAYKDAIIAAI